MPLPSPKIKISKRYGKVGGGHPLGHICGTLTTPSTENLIGRQWKGRRIRMCQKREGGQYEQLIQRKDSAGEGQHWSNLSNTKEPLSNSRADNLDHQDSGVRPILLLSHFWNSLQVQNFEASFYQYHTANHFRICRINFPTHPPYLTSCITP